MPAPQDAIVAVVALVAGLWIARRRFGLRLGVGAPEAAGCEKCASGDPCAPESAAPAPALKAHPLKLVRAPRR